MTTALLVTVMVNGESVQRFVEPRLSLADFLRRDLGLTGTHLGCEMGACGACLVSLNGSAVHSCLMLAVQADGLSVDTIEGLAESGFISDLQTAFHERNAMQCGFCTSGMLIAARECLAHGGVPSREEIRDAFSGNYCRCTGYQSIVDAIETVAMARAEKEVGGPV